MGTVFNLMDSFVGGVLGVLTTGRSMLEALRKFADCLDFIQKQVCLNFGFAIFESFDFPLTSWCLFHWCEQVGDEISKVSVPSSEVSFKDIIKAVKQLVDKQVSGTKPASLPLPDPSFAKLAMFEEAQEQVQPTVSGRHIQLAAPHAHFKN